MKKNDKPKDLREELLVNAEKKPIRKFRQFDVFWGEGNSDPDGDLLSSGQTYEFNRSACLRVLVPSGATQEDVIRGLKKISAWIKKDREVLTWNWGYLEKKSSYDGGGNEVIEPEIGLRYGDNKIFEPIYDSLEKIKTDRFALEEVIRTAKNMVQHLPQAREFTGAPDDPIPF
ncbi:MAG TPA: hypothetical protein VGK00_06190 [Anaerolineales bacterium]